MGFTFYSSIVDKRVHMGCLQLKRWLSFLPAAFIVYILLHYLVYQPDLTGPHSPVLVGRRSNESVVSVVEGRKLQGGARVLPPLSPDTGDELSDQSDAATSEVPPAALSAAGTGHNDDNTTVQQGSGATNPVSTVRFESVSRALGGDTAGSLYGEDSGVVGGGGGLVGSGGVEATYSASGTASRGDIATLSRGPEVSVGGLGPLEEASSAPVASRVHSTALAIPSTPRPAPPVAPDTWIRPPGASAPHVPVHLSPPLPVSAVAPPPYHRNDLHNLGSTYQVRDPYIHSPYGSPYDPYGAAYREKAKAVERALSAHSHAMAQMGGFHPPANDLSPMYDSFAYPGGRDLTMGEELPPHSRPGSGVQPVPVSTTRAVAPSGQAAPQPHTDGTAGTAPQQKQTVAKKTAVKKTASLLAPALAINALRGKIKVGEKYESGFSVPHEELCENNGRDLKVLVLITTAPDHEKHRTAVRQTWGHFTVRKDVVMAFVIGRTTNNNVQSNIDKENELFGDIIQANFIDHYSNLTLKTISMFEWVKTYCSESRFILKTDDDMFINMPLLLNFVDAKLKEQRVMYGRMAKGWKPVRNKKSKYYIDTSIYSKSKYPDFLTGPAYLFTSDVVDDIYQKALDTTFFVLEDVLITGIVSESLRIKRIGDSRFRNEKIKLVDTCSLLKTISIHMVKYEEQFDIYKRTLDGKAKCKAG
ncbi:uncharacterized protein LOC121854958 isoform X1 [Homarus americanus]|uniref:uncharacterized protein LOC121854958 isoform X1 n=1 Tax=Homarus americanus TaxID=6706 RepID=UPI001C47B2CA|nr:uncharacterized protein LOC121854958 isoform X1 [Homarus americanus]